LVDHRCSITWSVRPSTDGGIARFRGLEIDHKLEVRRLLDRQIGGLGRLEVSISAQGSAQELAELEGVSSK